MINGFILMQLLIGFIIIKFLKVSFLLVFVNLGYLDTIKSSLKYQ